MQRLGLTQRLVRRRGLTTAYTNSQNSTYQFLQGRTIGCPDRSLWVASFSRIDITFGNEKRRIFREI